MKKLFVGLVGVIYLLLSTDAGAVEKNFEFGGDLRLRSFYRRVDERFDEIDEKTRCLHQIRARLFGWLDLFEEKLHLHGQIRKPHFFGDNYSDDLNDSKVEVDLAYLQLNRIFDWPLEITLGKQELLYGEGFLTGDRDIFKDSIDDDPENFTAVKIRFLREQLTVDGFFSRVFSSDPEPPDNIENYDFAGLVARYEWRPEDTVEPYLFYSDDRSRELHNHPNNEKIWIIGCRGTKQISDNFYLKGEGCYQWGNFDTVSFARFGLGERDFKAWGGYLGGEYRFPVQYEPSLALTVINCSGEEYPDSGAYNTFHSLFRSARFGQLHDKYTDDNKMIVRTAFKCKPLDKLDVLLEWFSYQANEKPLDRENKHDGDEIDLRLDYEVNDQLSVALFAGWFSPGDYFPGAVITRAGGEDVISQVMGEVTFEF